MPEDGEINVKRKNPIGLWIGAGMILFGGLAVFSGFSSLTDDKTRLIAPDSTFTIEVADEQSERVVGLSNRSELGSDEGMLFVFDNATVSNCFWMKDTLIPLDMIWLDDDKKVVTVTENVQPDSFPESFCPSTNAKYGLEINAGRAQGAGISEGVELRF